MRSHQILVRGLVGCLLMAVAGCGGGAAKPVAQPTRASSPRETESLSPTAQPASAYGAVTTATDPQGYRFQLQAYFGPPVTNISVNGSPRNAPPGQVIPVAYVNVIDGATDRPEPLDFIIGDQQTTAIIIAVPAADASAFGLSSTCGPSGNLTADATNWCEMTTQTAQTTPEVQPIHPQIQPGQPVALVLAGAAIPQGAPLAKLALFANLAYPPHPVRIAARTP